MLNPLKNSDLSPTLNESPGPVPFYDTVAGLKVGISFMEGWIKLHRKVRENWIWKDPVKFQWWIDILLEVNHSPAKVPIGFDIIDCGKGQSVRSLQGWAQRWRTGKDTARNFLKMLQKDNMIVCENLTKTTRITVCNYESYQTELHVKQTPGKRKANGEQTQGDPNKNNKNEENEKIFTKAQTFYFDQITNNPLDLTYKQFVDFILGANDLKRPLYSVLNLRDQLTADQFLKLRVRKKKDESNVNIMDSLVKIDNDEKYTKGKSSLYTILLNWITQRFIKNVR